MYASKDRANIAIMALPYAYGNDSNAQISFLQLFSKLCVFVPVAQNGVTRSVILCVMFEETRFYNRVQKGMEPLAAKFDSGATLSSKEEKRPQEHWSRFQPGPD